MRPDSCNHQQSDVGRGYAQGKTQDQRCSLISGWVDMYMHLFSLRSGRNRFKKAALGSWLLALSLRDQILKTRSEPTRVTILWKLYGQEPRAKSRPLEPS